MPRLVKEDGVNFGENFLKVRCFSKAFKYAPHEI